MIRIRLSADDLAETRFAFSPVWELAESYLALQDPGKHVFHLPWINDARQRVADLDLEPIQALLVSNDGYRPDFVTPPPPGPYPDFDQEVRRILATPHDLVRHEVARMYEGRQMPRAARDFIEDPDAALRRLADSLAAYWDRTLAEHWPRLRGLLEGDVLYRAKRLALEGAEGLFQDLHPAVSWTNGILAVDKRHEGDLEPRGRGLLLLPVVFSCPTCTLVVCDPPWQPTMTYTPRGLANLWETERAPVDGILDELIGQTRASILRVLLEVPMTTSEVAAKLGVTPGAVSQQLAMLRRAGVLDSHRSGRGVYSELTPLGQSLVQLLAG
jgi:DNA-binding HxlR family transcriptional regulator